MWRTMLLACMLAVLTGCVSVQFVPSDGGDRISTAWGSNTSGGMNFSPVPTAAAGGNAIH